MTIDPVTFAVLSRSLTAIPKEMSLNLIRSAYSTILKEARDCSSALLNADGNIVTQGDDMPIHLNAMSMVVRRLAETYDFGELEPDDILITNDPYGGAQHLPDIFVYTPVFWKEKIIGFAGTVAHHLDVGGGGIGSLNPEAIDIYSEGVRIPNLCIKVENDIGKILFGKLFAANIRCPWKTIGDLNAQLGANRVGAKRLLRLVEKYGVETVTATMQRLIDYSERRTRELIQQIPDGTYTAEEIVDDDGITDRSYKIKVAVTVMGSNVHIDFTGTDSQAPGMINAPLAATTSAAMSAIKAIVAGETIPFNEGCIRPVTLTVPPGSLLNPHPPAPVRGRVNTCMRVFGAIMRALSDPLPQQVIASGIDVVMMVNLGYLTEKGWTLFTEPITGGYGAGYQCDGAIQCRTPLANDASTSIEAAEVEYDWVRITRYELLTDTGGAGQWCGAMGARKDFEILKDGVVLTTFSDRHKHKPWGLFGGHEGTCCHYIVRRDGQDIELPAKGRFSLKKGDILTVIVGGSGGYGDPRKRSRDLVIRDLREGKISVKKAQEVFGLDTVASAE